MGNLCSIHHAHFDKLIALTNNHQKAVFLDKCLFWWQISTYTLGCDKIWFTRSISEIANELSISERTVSRYLDEMEDKGLLERVSKLSASNKNGFRVIKRLYIHMTAKLLALLKLPARDQSEKDDNRTFLTQNGKIENANLAEPIYKDHDHNSVNNNNVSPDIVNRVNKKTRSQHNVIFPIEKRIAECIPDEVNTRVKGMLFNVLKEKGTDLIHHERLYSEVIFSLSNSEQFKGIDCLTHKINIISSLIRKKQWRTPKGFYNHSEIGQQFKERDLTRRRRLQQEKVARELIGITDPQEIAALTERISVSSDDDLSFSANKVSARPKLHNPVAYRELRERLASINNEIFSEGRYLQGLEKFYSKEEGSVREEALQCIRRKMDSLYREQSLLEQQLSALEQNTLLTA